MCLEKCHRRFYSNFSASLINYHLHIIRRKRRKKGENQPQSETPCVIVCNNPNSTSHINMEKKAPDEDDMSGWKGLKWRTEL